MSLLWEWEMPPCEGRSVNVKLYKITAFYILTPAKSRAVWSLRVPSCPISFPKAAQSWWFSTPQISPSRSRLLPRIWYGSEPHGKAASRIQGYDYFPVVEI